jgi:hypothetical protein
MDPWPPPRYETGYQFNEPYDSDDRRKLTAKIQYAVVKSEPAIAYIVRQTGTSNAIVALSGSPNSVETTTTKTDVNQVQVFTVDV